MLEDVAVSLITERRVSRPWGLAGGEPGAPVRLGHGSARVLLGTAGGTAQHLSHQVLEALGRDPVVGVIDQRVGVQAIIGHDSVNEIVDHGRVL